MMAWPTSGGLGASRDQRALDVLAAIFNDRLFDRLRAADGASYGPMVESHWPTGFEGSGGYLLAGSLPARKEVARFYAIAGAEGRRCGQECVRKCRSRGVPD